MSVGIRLGIDILRFDESGATALAFEEQLTLFLELSVPEDSLSERGGVFRVYCVFRKSSELLSEVAAQVSELVERFFLLFMQNEETVDDALELGCLGFVELLPVAKAGLHVADVG